jgi:hypothetical protein
LFGRVLALDLNLGAADEAQEIIETEGGACRRASGGHGERD